MLGDAFSIFVQEFSNHALCEDKADNIILIGDFNMPGYEWTQRHGIQCTTGYNTSRQIKDMHDSLLDMVNSFNLTQFY